LPLRLTPNDLKALQDIPDLVFRIPSPIAAQLLSVIQLASRHPNFFEGKTVAETSVNFAREIQKILSVTPNLKKLWEAGWHPEYDQPSKPRSRIIIPGRLENRGRIPRPGPLVLLTAMNTANISRKPFFFNGGSAA
jgi:hypothetical protein